MVIFGLSRLLLRLLGLLLPLVFSTHNSNNFKFSSKKAFRVLFDIFKLGCQRKLEKAMGGDRYPWLEVNVEVIHAANSSLH